MKLAWTFARALYLFAPLLFSAALAAIIQGCDLARSLKRPIDAGRSFGDKRIFGDSKTWRGVAIAVVGSVAAVFIQKHVFSSRVGALAVIDYARANPLVLGGAMGLAAMAGELPNSFVKRRLGIAPGKTAGTPLKRAVFWLWDQIDLLTLTWPALLPWIAPTMELVLASFVLAIVLHPLIALIGFLLGARKSAR